MCSSGVGGTLLERHKHRAFVFYLGLCMISCNITGTCSKSNGPKVSCASDVYIYKRSVYANTTLVYFELSPRKRDMCYLFE